MQTIQMFYNYVDTMDPENQGNPESYKARDKAGRCAINQAAMDAKLTMESVY